jgi:hypothetical protein
MAGFKSERVAGFNLECMAGFIGICRKAPVDIMLDGFSVKRRQKNACNDESEACHECC